MKSKLFFFVALAGLFLICFSTASVFGEDVADSMEQVAPAAETAEPVEQAAPTEEAATASEEPAPAEATAPEAEEAAPTEEAAASVEYTIEDAVICRDVVEHEPVGAGDVFPSDLNKIYCFTRVVGATEDTEIMHNWYYKETMVASVPLHVGSTNWRTYSSKTILPEYAGEWKVEIVSQDGNLLKKIYFMVE